MFPVFTFIPSPSLLRVIFLGGVSLIVQEIEQVRAGWEVETMAKTLNLEWERQMKYIDTSGQSDSRACRARAGGVRDGRRKNENWKCKRDWDRKRLRGNGQGIKGIKR